MVTAGQGSYRLGLAPILALSQPKMGKVKSEYNAAIISKLAELKAEAEKTQTRISHLRHQIETAENSARLLQNRFTDLKLPGFDSDDSDFALVALAKRLFGSGDKELDERLRAALEIRAALADLRPELQKNQAAYEAALSQSRDLTAELEALSEPSNEAPSWLRGKFISLLGENGVVLAKTDADGNFDAILPDDVRYLVCLSERQVVDNKESYLWVIDLTKEASFAEKRKVDFNNDNLAKVTVGLLNQWLP